VGRPQDVREQIDLLLVIHHGDLIAECAEWGAASFMHKTSAGVTSIWFMHKVKARAKF
jgi:hypothetical protein